MVNSIKEGFWLPPRIHKEMKREQSKFWWGQNSQPSFKNIAWNKICRRKCVGGLGIKDLPTMNRALLTKLTLKIMANPSSQLAKVLRARYEKGNAWGMTANVSNPS